MVQEEERNSRGGEREGKSSVLRLHVTGGRQTETPEGAEREGKSAVPRIHGTGGRQKPQRG